MCARSYLSFPPWTVFAFLGLCLSDVSFLGGSSSSSFAAAAVSSVFRLLWGFSVMWTVVSFPSDFVGYLLVPVFVLLPIPTTAVAAPFVFTPLVGCWDPCVGREYLGVGWFVL